jgi:hypothetical protein
MSTMVLLVNGSEHQVASGICEHLSQYDMIRGFIDSLGRY